MKSNDGGREELKCARLTGLAVSWEKKKDSKKTNKKTPKKTKSIPATKREKEHLPLTDFVPAKRLF